jgi:hypothetical protein
VQGCDGGIWCLSVMKEEKKKNIYQIEIGSTQIFCLALYWPLVLSCRKHVGSEQALAPVRLRTTSQKGLGQLGTDGNKGDIEHFLLTHLLTLGPQKNLYSFSVSIHA